MSGNRPNERYRHHFDRGIIVSMISNSRLLDMTGVVILLFCALRVFLGL